MSTTPDDELPPPVGEPIDGLAPPVVPPPPVFPPPPGLGDAATGPVSAPVSSPVAFPPPPGMAPPSAPPPPAAPTPPGAAPAFGAPPGTTPPPTPGSAPAFGDATGPPAFGAPPVPAAPAGTWGQPVPPVGGVGAPGVGAPGIGTPGVPPGGYQTYRPGGSAPMSYASIVRRFFAALIDGVAPWVLPGVLLVIIQPRVTSDTVCAIGESDCASNSPALDALTTGVLGLYVVMTFVLVILPMGRTGQSLGSRALGIRVVDARTGTPPGVVRAFGRYVVASLISGFCSLGYIWALSDERKQTWHDKALSTVVVRA